MQSLYFLSNFLKFYLLVSCHFFVDLSTYILLFCNCLTHTVITSVIVKLDHTLGECNAETVADMVKNLSWL